MSAAEQARAHLDAGEFERARTVALEELKSRADDPELLEIAGRAGVETGAEDAVEQLRRLTELRPDDARAWYDLGDALATEGATEEANQAFRRTVELDPEHEAALTALGHTSFAAGKDKDAVSYLEQAADRSASRMSTAHLSLVEMYRSMGELEEALAAARKISEAEPTDTLAALDVAELSLELGRLDEALEAFARVREVDELSDHEVYALYGMIQAELAREGWERALELAREAGALDKHGRTAGVVAFLEAKVSGASEEEEEEEEPPPSREQVDAALSASQEEHRRSHAEDRRTEEDLVG